MATSQVPIATQGNEPMVKEFPFALHRSVEQYKDAYKTYLQKYPFYEIREPKLISVAVSWVVVGALTFHPTSIPPRILLIQRSTKDSMPNLWEIPGGGCDESDESILHSVARELKEEAGLETSVIGPAIGQGYVFNLAPGKFTRKISFVVELESSVDSVDVQLDPSEHRASVWATEEEVRHGRAGDLELSFTSEPQRDVILEAFEVRKAIRNEAATDSAGE